MPRSYQVTPVILGRRRATQRIPVRPSVDKEFLSQPVAAGDPTGPVGRHRRTRPDDDTEDEFRREAMQMLRAGRTPRELAESLGVSQQTLRNWRRQDQIDRRERDDGPTTDEREELRRLRRENARLKQERDLLKRAAAFFARETETR
jgi:transposase